MNLPRHLKMSHKTVRQVEYDLIPTHSDELNSDSRSLTCYFKCNEVFSKEMDLLVHIKLKHSGEGVEEISKANIEAAEQSEFKTPSASIWCELCDSTLSGRSSFWMHITRKHKMPFKDYEAEFGKVVTDSEPFQCELCSKQLKHDRSSISTHLMGIHGVTWPQYLATIEDIKSGSISSPPPPAKVHCKLCNSSVKNFKSHLRCTHNMTLNDYINIDDKKVKKEEELEAFSYPKHNVIKEEGSTTPNITKEESQLNQSQFKTTNSLKSATCKKILLQLDIRNKSLKKCNVCQLNFPTRKTFIEHLQAVHGMKFKLKSGESLPPPNNC